MLIHNYKLQLLIRYKLYNLTSSLYNVITKMHGCIAKTENSPVTRFLNN